MTSRGVTSMTIKTSRRRDLEESIESRRDTVDFTVDHDHCLLAFLSFFFIGTSHDWTPFMTFILVLFSRLRLPD